MRYIDRYVVERRENSGPWEHVAEVYPEYRWRACRIWLLLGLFCRAKIVNNAAGAALRAKRDAASIALGLIAGNANEQFRIWEYRHNGLWMVREIDAEFDGSLI